MVINGSLETSSHPATRGLGWREPRNEEGFAATLAQGGQTWKGDAAMGGESRRECREAHRRKTWQPWRLSDMEVKKRQDKRDFL